MDIASATETFAAINEQFENNECALQKLVSDQNSESIEDQAFGKRVWAGVICCVLIALLIAAIQLRNPNGLLVGSLCIAVFISMAMANPKPPGGDADGCAPLVILVILLRIGNAVRLGVTSFWLFSKLKKRSNDRVAALADAQAKRKSDFAQLQKRAAHAVQEKVAVVQIIRSFLWFRESFKSIESTLPIGVRLDKAVASLNDMTFGSVVSQCEALESALLTTTKNTSISLPRLEPAA